MVHIANKSIWNLLFDMDIFLQITFLPMYYSLESLSYKNHEQILSIGS